MKPEWFRAQVWAEHDARLRRRRSLVAALASGFVAMLWVANYSCVELMFLDEPVRAPRPGTTPSVSERCQRDSDCAVLPAIISCCGDCPPVAPFEAVLRTELDELRSDCTPQMSCEAPICGAVPSCTPKAVCTNGQCRVAGECEH